MILTFEQIQDIVKNNPNKKIIDEGKQMATQLLLHVEGIGLETAIKKCDHFADQSLYEVQKAYAMSNKDVMARLLQQEDMIFMARGGSTYFKLPDTDEQAMNSLLNNIEYGISLRSWIKSFALPAYRTDPMGVIFMEIEQLEFNEDGSVKNTPRAYPTYKSIYCIHDYKSTGRKLEYICFKLTAGEARTFGIKDESLDKVEADKESIFYRIVDDRKDLIVMFKDSNVSLVTSEKISQKNPIANYWNRTPAFIVSDLIKYKNPSIFMSPLYNVVELCDTFLQDRSVRDLQKKFHGYAKAVEPLLQCGTCNGDKYVNGEPCKACTPPGGVPTGYKLKTKVSDVARFPLTVLESGSFDFTRIYGYVTPDIKGWDKQDSSLESNEQLIEMTYWGTIRIKRPAPKAAGTGTNSGEAITATESDSNEAPKIARLNMTADWAEKTENLIADFIGQFWFPDSYKQGAIAYGRDYILKTPEELMAAYQKLLTSGSPDFAKDEAIEKYYQAKYQNNPTQLAKYMKMLNVEPFPHDSVANIEKSTVVPFNDKLAKRYFGEWADTIPDIKWVVMKAPALIEELKNYITAKSIPEPKPTPAGGMLASSVN